MANASHPDDSGPFRASSNQTLNEIRSSEIAAIEYRHVDVDASDGGAILRDVSLLIGKGEAVAIIGRSGAGKTTALRLVNGLTSPRRGEMFVDGHSLARVDLIALRRRIGYMIQGVGLFPHRTVYENVATVPRLLGWDETDIESAARSLLDRLSIPFDPFGSRFPSSLSGGEKQRVGIARALAAEPDLLLCDEPFAALDPIVRREQQQAFAALRRDRGITMLFVTHDLREALTVADRIVLVDAGRIVVDAPKQGFLRSEHPLVRAFIESATIEDRRETK